MKPLISVIIPAYNAEKTIKRCIESIQKQTYKNLQIIAVNDGSTDNTYGILSEIKSCDKRIQIISIPNGGVSHARNVGIDAANGDYITFVDADDTIEDNMYEYLLNLSQKYNAQISHCSYSNYNPSGFVSYVGNNGKILKQDKEEALDCLLSGKYFTGGMWNKFYSSQLFDTVRFDEKIKINEDVLANFQLFCKAETLVYSDLCLYNYYNYVSSSTSTTNQERKLRESLYVAETIFENSIGKNYEKAAMDKLAYAYLLLYRYLITNNIKNKNEKKELKIKIKNYLENNCYSTKSIKFSALLSLYFPKVFRLVYYFYDKIRIQKYDPEQ